MNGIVQIMNKLIKDNIDHFNLLRKNKKKDKKSQRELAKELGFSLGKIKLFTRITKERLNKNRNFKRIQTSLITYITWTPKGITKETSSIISFMKRKCGNMKN